jgi:hypothetical protein
MTMQNMPKIQRPRVALWTHEKIGSLTTPEVRQLHTNAMRLQETEIASLCDTVLAERGRSRSPVRRPRAAGQSRRLVSRSVAFGLCGVELRSRFWSRGGVRASDGAVVMALWADDVAREAGACSYLLWAENVDGSRPWSDKPGGRERLEHCERAAERGVAEGLLVYGERLEGVLPEDKALRVDGVEPGVVLSMRVEKRAQGYWAVWNE